LAYRRAVIDLALIHFWTEQMCRLPLRTAADAMRDLGIEGALVDRGHGSSTVEPPPAGTTRFAIVLTSDGIAVDRLELELAGGFTRAQLDHELGYGIDRPRVGPDRPFDRAHPREDLGAPNLCEVVARFATQPEPHTVSTDLKLKIVRL